MSDLYDGCDACRDLADVESGFVFDLNVIETALKRIYETDFNPMTDIEESLFRETLKTFNHATDKGIAMGHAPLQEQVEFVNALKTNNAVFSAFRTHRMQNDIAAQLLDEKGKLKPFNQFVKDTSSITDHHVNQWLRTEYDTAVIRAHGAADWKQFEDEKDVLPNLEWMPTTSVTPGADHQIFWGVIHPIDSPFWSAHRPGDRWNCKCRLQATDKLAAVETGHAPSVGKSNNPQPGLDNNPAKDGKLFSDTHPFRTKTYPGANEAVAKFLDKEGILKIVDSLKEYAEYTKVKKFSNGGELFTHKLADKTAKDYKLVKSVGLEFARTGAKVKATPRVHFKSDEYKDIYGSLIGTKYERKCPDLLINGKFYEVESFEKPWKKQKVRKMLSHGALQSSRLIIDNTKGCSDRFIRRSIYDRLHVGTKIEEVWLYEKGKLRKLF
jgi:hypothetical protein